MEKSDTRPNPDKLLDLVNLDRGVSARGRLKLFFGASAGVGKTYAMLAEARRKKAQGVDIIAGVVETHGRDETASLLEGLPLLPAREIGHRGVTLREFDLEAALARKPSLILMDELAHSNAPGSLHPKRWQDVEELLRHGIDVYTTLNVQHLESVNDTVAKLTGIVVRETVPDSLFDAADEVALIDLPSDDLLRRLDEGKVYIAEGAGKRAAENFFKKPNLVALRELALRRTADRVDAEGDTLTAAQGRGEAQLGQKILACIGHDALSKEVIRHAKRMAIRGKGRWYALYVETGRHERLNDRAKLSLERNLRLAERMGAHIVRLFGDHAAEEILNYARHYGFTRIVVGHRHKPALFRRTLAGDLLKRGEGFEITAITEKRAVESSPFISFRQRYFVRPSDYVLTALLIAVSTGAILPFRETYDTDDFTMAYITVVTVIAAYLGIGPGIFASFASVLAFNFFFTRPYHSFHVYNSSYSFTFVLMLVSSLTVGSLAARLSRQVRQFRKREEETRALYALTRDLSELRSADEIARAALGHIRRAFGMESVIFLAHEKELSPVLADAAMPELKEESVLRWAFQNAQMAGRNTDTMPSARGLYLPMVVKSETLGVIGFMARQEDEAFTGDELIRIETFVGLIAAAFQSARHASEAEHGRLEAENERLRSAILSSLSHDLRTPLASIATAAHSVLIGPHGLPDKVRAALTSIEAQSNRLTRIVSNLLDITRLEMGQLSLNRQPYYLEEVIGAALSEIEELKGQRNIEIQLNAADRLIEIDGLLIEQVLINLLDNAIKFTPPDGRILIRVDNHADGLLVSVEDSGRGIPESVQKNIFDKFYVMDGQTGTGTGLGLAICRAIIELHGGKIWVDDNILGGATLLFSLPRKALP